MPEAAARRAEGGVKQGVEGYVEGLQRLPGEDRRRQHPRLRAAPAQPWVRPIDKWTSTSASTSSSSTPARGVAIDGIAERPAARRRAALGAYERAEAATAEVTAAERGGVEELGEALDLSDDIGSNAWGLGSEATEGRRRDRARQPALPLGGPAALLSVATS